jgi:hypothetical protein
MPRFTFLDCDLKKNPTNENEVKRKKQPIKPIFVGSPVRSIETGGLLTLSASHKRSKEHGEEVDLKSKKSSKSIKGKSDPASCKGSLDFFLFMNESNINRIRDRITPSASIALTKAQRSRQLSKVEEEAHKQNLVFKRMQEQMADEPSGSHEDHADYKFVRRLKVT